MKNKVVAFITDFCSWGCTEANDTIRHLARDFRSMKALWNWLFLALYVWICVYLVLKYAAICGNTVVTATSAIVISIFTNYVWSNYMVKKNIDGPAKVNINPSGGSNGISGTTSITSPTTSNNSGGSTSGDDVQ